MKLNQKHLKAKIFLILTLSLSFLLIPRISVSISSLKELTAEYDKLLNQIKDIDITFVTTDTLLTNTEEYLLGEQPIFDNNTIETARVATKNNRIRLYNEIYNPKDKKTFVHTNLLCEDNPAKYFSQLLQKEISAVFIKSSPASEMETVVAIEYFCAPMMLPSSIPVPEYHRIDCDLRNFLRIKGMKMGIVNQVNDSKREAIKVTYKNRFIYFDKNTLSPILWEQTNKGKLVLQIIMRDHLKVFKNSTIGYPSYVELRYYANKNDIDYVCRIRKMKVYNLKVNEKVLKSDLSLPNYCR